MLDNKEQKNVNLTQKNLSKDLARMHHAENPGTVQPSGNISYCI